MPRRRQVCNKKCSERAVGDAGPYGEITSSAVRRADVGIGPYGDVTRSAVSGTM